MPDYLPRTDGEFDQWFADFVAYAQDHAPELGMTEHDLAELMALATGWKDALARHRTAREKSREATMLKEAARSAGERAIRKHVRLIQARPATTNGHRRGLGITPRPEVAPQEAAILGVGPPGGAGAHAGY